MHGEWDKRPQRQAEGKPFGPEIQVSCATHNDQSNTHKSRSETNEEARADEHAEVLGSRLKDRSNEDKSTTENDPGFAAKDISHIWCKWSRGQRSIGEMRLEKIASGTGRTQ